MQEVKFEILSADLLEAYCNAVVSGLLTTYKSLTDSELSVNTFSFYTSVAAVYSSKIEGENIELDSYVKHKRFGIEFLPDYTQKTDDLYKAYQFAKSEKLNQENITKAHQILTQHILPKSKQGKIRTSNMYITTADGKIEYVTASSFAVPVELQKFYADMEALIQQQLTLQQVFFFAALLHLVFVKIHPYNDGNGRTSRLIEKWFLAEKLGEKAWLIQSEKNYYLQHSIYYKNIRLLGLEYVFLDFSKALPFLLMLPQSLNKNNNS